MKARRYLRTGLVSFLFIVSTAGYVWGQAAFDSERVRHGGWAGPVVKFASMQGTAARLLGVQGGWIISVAPRHSFVLGIGAYGVMNDIPASAETPGDEEVSLGVDYGGMEVGYVNHVSRQLHLSIQALVGAGGVGYRKGGDRQRDTRDGFFIAEPGLFLSFNVLPFARLSGGVSYRYVGPTSLAGVAGDELGGVTGVAAVQLGRF